MDEVQSDPRGREAHRDTEEDQGVGEEGEKGSWEGDETNSGHLSTLHVLCVKKEDARIDRPDGSNYQSIPQDEGSFSQGEGKHH